MGVEPHLGYDGMAGRLGHRSAFQRGRVHTVRPVKGLAVQSHSNGWPRAFGGGVEFCQAERTAFNCYLFEFARWPGRQDPTRRRSNLLVHGLELTGWSEEI